MYYVIRGLAFCQLLTEYIRIIDIYVLCTVFQARRYDTRTTIFSPEGRLEHVNL